MDRREEIKQLLTQLIGDLRGYADELEAVFARFEELSPKEYDKIMLLICQKYEEKHIAIR